MSQYKAKAIKPKTDKTPDEFVTTMDRVTRYLGEHRSTIIGIVSILLIAGCVYFGMQYFQDKKIAEMNQLSYQAGLLEDENAKLAAYQDIIKKYPDSTLSAYLQLNLIESNLKGQKLDQALTQINELKQKNIFSLNGGLVFSEVNILWSQDRHQEAIDLIDKQMLESGANIKNFGSYLKSLILEDMGDIEEAKKIYDSLLQDKELSPNLKNQVKARLVWLSIK